MDLKRDKPLVDLVFAAYSVVLAGVWMFAAETAHVGRAMVALHLFAAGLLVQLPATGVRGASPWTALRRGYPYVAWVLAWSELGWLHRLHVPVGHDAGVLVVDQALFGVHWHQRWAEIMPWSGLGEILHLSYLSYYLLILGPPAALALARRRADLDRFTLGLMATYLVCFLVYLALPVYGPRALAVGRGVVEPVVDGGVMAGLVEALRRAGDSPGTAFPSSHCAGVTAVALLARRCFSPATGRWLAVWAALVVASTVYTRNHYALDAVAGVLTAGLVHRVVVFAECRRAGVDRLPAGGRRLADTERSWS